MSTPVKPNNDYDDDKIPEADVIVLEHSGWHKFDIQKPNYNNNINYAITGHESQVLTMRLKHGDSLQGEPGSMVYLSSGISQSVTYEGCMERCCSGESCFILNYNNNGSNTNINSYAALTPSFPTSKIIPIDLSSSNVNGTLITQQGAFMASYGDVRVGVSLDFNIVRCCCGGLGLVRQKIEGTGTVFLEGTGTMVQKILDTNETILIDTNCIMAYSGTCKLDLKRVGGVLGMIGSGEGIFNTTLTGPGLVIVQSMNQTMFREALAAQKLYRR